MNETGKQSEWLVSMEQSGLRLDQVLAVAWPDRSRAFFQKCISEGTVLFNSTPANSSSKRVKAGDRILVHWPEPASQVLCAENIPLDILQEDEDILVLNKPAGLVVHPGSGNTTGTLVQGLLFHDEEAFSGMDAEDLRPGIVHRLDKDTSGVLVVAKTTKAEAALKESFKSRHTEKTYLAVAIGSFQHPSGEISGSIGRSPHKRRKMAVVSDGGKPALTRYRILAESASCSLLEVQILTGRTHQIRVHLASIHHPILGDSLYGGRPARMPFLPQRQLLHAWKLSFPHPTSGEIIRCKAAPPQDFLDALTALGLSAPGAG
jgi:23S rRNA pseudouridine1911/1915/1917 synthase